MYIMIASTTNDIFVRQLILFYPGWISESIYSFEYNIVTVSLTDMFHCCSVTKFDISNSCVLIKVNYIHSNHTMQFILMNQLIKLVRLTGNQIYQSDCKMCHNRIRSLWEPQSTCNNIPIICLNIIKYMYIWIEYNSSHTAIFYQ